MAFGRWIERWVADDAIITTADGQVLTNPKDAILEAIRSGRYKIDSIAIDGIAVRVFDNAAVATATQTEASKFDGRDSGGRYQYTHVWVKRAEGWTVVAAHVTRLPSTP